MTEDVVHTVYNNYRPYCEPFCRIVDVNQYDMGEIAQYDIFEYYLCERQANS
jgi:endogenous inhibitor of DNA gyrase (YacG/DUF329 family)